MKQSLAIRSPQPYADALASAWRELGSGLRRLDELAATPSLLADPEEAATLAALQYRLHAAGEAVLDLEPPAEAEEAHAELGAALVAARDATALIADQSGLGSVEPLVYEWRGALFRVRLARHELRRRQSAAPPAARLAWLSWWHIQGVLVAGVALVVLGLVLLRP